MIKIFTTTLGCGLTIDGNSRDMKAAELAEKVNHFQKEHTTYSKMTALSSSGDGFTQLTIILSEE